MMGFEGGDFRGWLRLHEVLKVEPQGGISALSTKTFLPCEHSQEALSTSPLLNLYTEYPSLGFQASKTVNNHDWDSYSSSEWYSPKQLLD